MLLASGLHSSKSASNVVADRWGTAQPFDRTEGYDASWVHYDKVDIFGEPLSAEAKL